jgi:hypothetical protein
VYVKNKKSGEYLTAFAVPHYDDAGVSETASSTVIADQGALLLLPTVLGIGRKAN